MSFSRPRRWLVARAALVSSAAIVFLALPLRAQTIAYDFSWVGTGGYSMGGNFSFDAASAADGAIRDFEVLGLTFEGFLNNVSIGVNNTAHTLAGFNFNFNAVAGQFFLGGSSTGESGQRWNFVGSGLGFGAGNLASVLSFDASDLGSIFNPTPLVATRADVVPEPATMTLLATGLAGMAAARRKKRKA